MTTRFLIPSSLLWLTCLAAACSGGGGGGGGSGQTEPGEQFVADGTLTLAGPDTAILGTELRIGDVARITGPGDVRTYFCVDAATTVPGFEYTTEQLQAGQGPMPSIGDPFNTFVINAIDGLFGPGSGGISMSIVFQGVSYDYTCTNCDGLTFEDASNRILFDDVVVDPQGAATAALRLNGEILYGIPDA